MDLGFIGLGAMGAPMAAGLVARGFAVSGYDIDPAAGAALVARGGRAAASAAEAAARRALLVVMVATGDQARASLIEEGALAALAPDAIVVLMATCAPREVEALAAEVEASGRRLVDAPVSGGVAGARRASLTVMAAGDRAAIAAAEPVLRALSARLFVVGDRPGQGAVAKAVNQLLCGVHIAAAAEAFSLAERLGLDAKELLEIVSGSAASSWMLRDRGPRMIAPPGEVTSAIDIFCKDLGIVLEAGRGAQAALPIAAAAFQMFLASAGRGEGRLDDSQVIASWRRLGGC